MTLLRVQGNPMPKRAGYSHLYRAGLTAAAAVLLAGCFKAFPRRVPGSDMTLPPSTSTRVLEALLDCAGPLEPKEGTGGARDVAKCRTAGGDTIPNPRTPTPPTPVP